MKSIAAQHKKASLMKKALKVAGSIQILDSSGRMMALLVFFLTRIIDEMSLVFVIIPIGLANLIAAIVKIFGTKSNVRGASNDTKMSLAPVYVSVEGD